MVLRLRQLPLGRIGVGALAGAHVTARLTRIGNA
jgi:hypothetical protein